MKRLAICAGLTRVNPLADDYDGWDGECPGCDRDAARFATACHDAGFDGVQVFINEAVSIPFIKPAFNAAANVLKAGDLLVLFNSGHGGQMPDDNGDELDGKDETLCWWDGEVVDDKIGTYLAKLNRGVRVLFVTDTCNSGTNFRGMTRRSAPKHSSPVHLSARAIDLLKCDLLHIGGCADGRSSYGDDEGGELTIALLDALARARRPITYREWFDRAASRMPSHQVPVFDEVNRSFADAEMLM